MLARVGQVFYWALPLAIVCASCTPNAPRPKTIEIAITAEGKILWNGEVVSCEEFKRRLNAPRKPGESPTPFQCDKIDKLLNQDNSRSGNPTSKP